MTRRKFGRPSHATVVAYLALFVALGGSAYAVDTVNSSDIVDGQVKSVDVGDAEIKSADVKDQSLTTFDVSTFLGADIVDGTITGADVADTSSLESGDIHEEGLAFNNTLLSSDLAPGSVGSSEVADHSLTANDVGENEFNFAANVPGLGAHTCSTSPITGAVAQGDHLLLTPEANTSVAGLTYGIAYRSDSGNAQLQVCNTSPVPINGATTNFNLLVFQH